MKIMTFAGALVLMAWAASPVASAVPGWRQMADWGVEVMAQSAIGGAAGWLWEMIHTDGPPRPVIGVEPLPTALLSTCVDADFQFANGRPDQREDQAIVQMASGTWNVHEAELTNDLAMARLYFFGGTGIQVGAFDRKLGMFDETRSPVPSDPAEAARCLAYPAQHGLAAAQTMLGFLYLSGGAGATNLSAFFKLEQAAAATGYPAAEYNLGLAYCYGFGVPVGTVVTARMQQCDAYLKSAALHGFPLAQRARRQLGRIEGAE